MSTDNEINAILEEIDDLLAQMPQEERLKYFAAISKPKDMDFVRKAAGAYYVDVYKRQANRRTIFDYPGK